MVLRQQQPQEKKTGIYENWERKWMKNKGEQQQ